MLTWSRNRCAATCTDIPSHPGYFNIFDIDLYRLSSSSSTTPSPFAAFVSTIMWTALGMWHMCVFLYLCDYFIFIIIIMYCIFIYLYILWWRLLDMQKCIKSKPFVVSCCNKIFKLKIELKVIIFLVVWSVENNNLAKTTTWLLPSLLFDQKTAGIDKIDFLTKFPGKKAAILFLLCCFRSLLRKSVALRVESTAAYFQGKSCGFSKCFDAKKPTRYQAAYKFVWNVE